MSHFPLLNINHQWFNSSLQLLFYAVMSLLFCASILWFLWELHPDPNSYFEISFPHHLCINLHYRVLMWEAMSDVFGKRWERFTSLMMNQIALYWGCKGEMQSNKKPPGNRRITLKVKDLWTADSDDSPPGWLVTLQQLSIRSIYCVLLDLICIIVNLDSSLCFQINRLPWIIIKKSQTFKRQRHKTLTANWTNQFAKWFLLMKEK